MDGLKVVVKTQRSALPTVRDIAKIRHEYEVLSKMRGPGVPTVHALESVGHRVVLVMADEGLTSLDRLLENPIELGAVLRVVAAVARILRRAHEQHIVHKDIKPHNIVARLDPLEVCIIDWGTAAQLSGRCSGEIDAAHVEEATLAYIAPEQTGLVDRSIDARTDLYLLGATSYQLLTGVLPFTDEDPRALLHSHLTRTPLPPHHVDPRIPASVSDIVMTLLAKSPEDRYTTARGLERDLVECSEQWEKSGEIVPFALGRFDRSSELLLPEKLYGREGDITTALSAFHRVQGGATELLLVTGGGGIGKSALVREVCSAMRLEGARFARGKFEQFRGGTPHASLIQAFRELLQQSMAERGDALGRWKTELQAALGEDVGAWSAMLPELGRVLGSQPPPPDPSLDPGEGRFHRFAQQLVSVFARPERPLVLFFDDLQWAEPASMQVLERLLASSDGGHLLIIGAYRDHDADAIGFLSHSIDTIVAAGVPLSRIELGPLARSDVSRFVADALGTTAPDAEALGAEIHRKTQGNPFFVGQLLLSLAQQALVVFDEERGEWTWDLPAIATRAVTSNVAEFMVERFRLLDPAAQELLRLGACLGGDFEHDVLADLAGQSTAACARGLWSVLVEGFIVPLHDDYRLLREGADTSPAPSSNTDASSELSRGITYRFLHDRVQEAAYGLLEEGRRAQAHLRIAQILLARRQLDARNDDLFTIVEHLNAGRELITEPEQRLTAARLNLEAGHRAKESVAYDAARTYLRQGIDHLPENSRDIEYELALALRTAYAEIVCMCSDFAEADALFEALNAWARSEMDRIAVQLRQIKLVVKTARYEQVVRIGRRILSSLGFPLPEGSEAYEAAVEGARDVVSKELQRRTTEEVVGAAPMTDPRLKIALQTLVIIDAPAFAVNAQLSALISLLQVQMSLEHGPSEDSCLGFMTYGQMLLRKSGRSEVAERAAEIGWLLYERYPKPEWSAMMTYARFGVESYLSPFPKVIAFSDKAIELALRNRDMNVLMFMSHVTLGMRITAGEDLSSIAERIESLRKPLKRAKCEKDLRLLALIWQFILCLQGKTRHPCSLSDESFDEEAFLRSETVDVALGHFYSFKVTLLCLHGDAGALSLLDEAFKRHREISVLFHVQMCFQVCLLLCRLIEGASGADVERHRAMLEQHHATVAQRRALSEEKWRCHDLLIKAERARIEGSWEEAQSLYDHVMTLAEQDGLPHVHAQASELCGRHHAARCHARIARVYLTNAYHGWLRWGAAGRAAVLVSQFPELVTQAPEGAQRVTATTSRHTSTVALQGVLYDLGQVMAAARAISSELAVSGVLEQFLRASAVAATVKQAFVILTEGGELEIAARFTMDPLSVTTEQRGPVAGTTELSESIVQYVGHSHEHVVLGTVDDASLFAGDPYLKRHRAKLIVCLPLLHRERLVGVWYAESDSRDGLREGSLALLNMLASQAASALENAYLYAQLKATTGDLAVMNRTLESEVASRTTELRESNGRLIYELDERAQVERERASLQQRIIEMQQDMLLEMSAPLIPISKRVAVMPLIGTMDERRADHIVSTALAVVHERGTRVLIVDLTGLRHMSKTTAGMLPRMASALGLIGARVVLTGVRPDTARMLVELDLDMSMISLKQTLQAGIAFATRRAAEN